MSIAVVSLILMAILSLVAVPILARVAGLATRRNQDRPEGGGETGSAQGRPNDEEIHDEAEAIKRVGPVFGVALGVFGVLAGLAGGLFGLGEGLLGSAIPATSMGIFLGIAGYVLGARGVGRTAAVFSVVALIFAMSVGQGYVPGLEPTDRGLPSQEPGAGAGVVD